MTRFLKFPFLLLTMASAFAQNQKATELTPEQIMQTLAAQAFAKELRISQLRHAALDAVDRKEIPHLREFLKLYPDAVVRYLSFANAEFPSLCATTTLYNRYEFEIRIPVNYTPDNRAVTGYGPPQCHLLETESVKTRDGLAAETSYGDLQKHFGEGDWKKLVASKGDFAALGWVLKKDAPVKHFDAVIAHRKSLARKIPRPLEKAASDEDNKQSQ
jgi:hypothetical protein